MSKQKNWKVRSHSEPIADTGDYDGYWEIVNDKGDSFRTSEDYDDIEKDLQKIADLLNSFDGALSLETACEINLHCDNMQLKMEIDQLKQPKDSPYQGSAGVWVKASERLPKVGIYNALYNGDHVIFQVHDGGFRVINYHGEKNDSPKLFLIRYLDDSAASPAGDGEAIEILKELCWLKSHKDAVGKDYLYNDRQPLAWQRANDFLNGLVKKEKL